MRTLVAAALTTATLLCASPQSAEAQVLWRPWLRPRVVFVPPRVVLPVVAPPLIAPPVMMPPQVYVQPYPQTYYYPQPAPPPPVYVQPAPPPAPVYDQQPVAPPEAAPLPPPPAIAVQAPSRSWACSPTARRALIATRLTGATIWRAKAGACNRSRSAGAFSPRSPPRAAP